MVNADKTDQRWSPKEETGGPGYNARDVRGGPIRHWAQLKLTQEWGQPKSGMENSGRKCNVEKQGGVERRAQRHM
ncbi:hypothetical protein N7488_000959 [Penicillium malachiteum]|nr:hypothetical protein N7488_000959 [Penicillium malachiteum]